MRRLALLMLFILLAWREPRAATKPPAPKAQNFEEIQRVDHVAAVVLQTGLAAFLGGGAIALAMTSAPLISRSLIAFFAFLAGIAGIQAGQQLLIGGGWETGPQKRERIVRRKLWILMLSVLAASLTAAITAIPATS